MITVLRILVIVICFGIFQIHGEIITWNPDVIAKNENFFQDGNIARYRLSVATNGPILRHPQGHVRFNVSISLGTMFRPLSAISSCVGITDPGATISKTLFDTILGEYPLLPGDDIPLGNYVNIDVNTTYEDFGRTNSSLYSIFIQMKAIRAMHELQISFSTENCYPIKTIGMWNDASRWSNGIIPRASDSVVIPADAGAIYLSSNVTVKDLTMEGGDIYMISSSCPSGWSADDRQFNTGKCYRLFDTSVNFAEAERICNHVVGEGGTDDRHLMHISDSEENDLARRLCRGTTSSDTFQRGCWIGLRENGDGRFSWLSQSAVGAAVSGKRGAMFLDWRRNEPNNMTVSNGVATYGGEQCARLVPWQQDPLVVEQGAWADDACQNTRPFLCQVFSPTTRYSLTVTGVTSVVMGVVHGGTLWSVGSAVVQRVSLLRGASLWLSSSAATSRVQRVVLMDAARLVVLGRVYLYGRGYLGDIAPATYRAMLGVVDNDKETEATEEKEGEKGEKEALYAQSLVVVAATGALLTTSQSDLAQAPSVTDTTACNSDGNGDGNGDGSNAQNVTVEARLVVRGGNVTVGACASLLLQQGGDLSKANVRFVASSSLLSLDGYAGKLSAFDAFTIHSANRGAFVGEYYNGDVDAEFENKHRGVSRGVYRLVVRRGNGNGNSNGSFTSGNSEVTECLQYNASATELQAALNALSLVASYGGVSVRRYGDSDSATHRFGFSYRVDFDAPHTADFYRGALSLAVHCYGPFQNGCGCAQTKVPLVDGSGTATCENHANVSTVDSGACVHAPELSVERVSTLAFINTQGSSSSGTTGGSLAFTAGLHRLPPVTPTSVRIVGRREGVGVVAADEIVWSDMYVGGSFRMMVAGTRWAGWDSVFDLFAPDWDMERGLASLHRAPPCTMRLTEFSVNDLAGVFSTGPRSNFTWQRGAWNGGVLGGRSALSITERVVLNGSNRALRDVMTLTIESTATLTWLAGNISLANAATLVSEGVFLIANTGKPNATTDNNNDNDNKVYFPWAMGEADYLNDSSSNAAAAKTLLLDVHPGRSWQSYYSAQLLAAELRAGWYLNPFCGESCGATNLFFIRGNGELRANLKSQTTFVLPVYLVDQSRFNLDRAATASFASGGTFGNQVVVTLGTAARLELSGGRMLMQATCTIQGSGDLQVTGGAHDLSFIIDARITISGGRLTWPQSRGDGNKITFRGGLIIEQSGQLIVEPQSTVIQVESDVYFKDNCLIQFPVLGIAAQSTPFDGPDFPDTSPRCTLNATRILRWEGGTIAGKVDIISRSFLYLDGDTKRVESLAKLLNYGHCEWGSGDLLIENNGDFVNYGSIQMAQGQAKFDANVVYRGTAIPLTNGGDPFAKDFHTYDLDPGGLNYAEYVALNGRFVSILPVGWTEASQIAGDGKGGLHHTD